MIRPDERRFSIRVRPTLFGASVAPIKAIFFGSSIDRRTGRRSRSAVGIGFDLSVTRLPIFWMSTCFVRLRLVNNSQKPVLSWSRQNKYFETNCFQNLHSEKQRNIPVQPERFRCHSLHLSSA